MTTQRISRTDVVKKIEEQKGRFFTVTFQKKDNSLRTINCNRKNNATTKLGYLNVYSIQDKGYRNIDVRTISAVRLQNQSFKIN